MRRVTFSLVELRDIDALFLLCDSKATKEVDMQEKQVNSDNNTIKFNFDDFDIESFDLKPVNRGLGFHKPQERVRPKSVPQKIDTPRVSVLNNQKPIPRPLSSLTEVMPAHLESERPTFLKNEVKPVAKEETFIKLKRASGADRSLAFLIDLTFILLMMLGVGVIVALALSHPINLETLENLAFSLSFNLSCLGVFCVMYLLYFGVLDMHSSFGKEIMGLNVKSISQSNLAFTQTLMRTVLSLFSFIALGLPLILDFHSRLTDSCVFKSQK